MANERREENEVMESTKGNKEDHSESFQEASHLIWEYALL